LRRLFPGWKAKKLRSAGLQTGVVDPRRRCESGLGLGRIIPHNAAAARSCPSRNGSSFASLGLRFSSAPAMTAPPRRKTGVISTALRYTCLVVTMRTDDSRGRTGFDGGLVHQVARRGTHGFPVNKRRANINCQQRFGSSRLGGRLRG
jgi:hypothetical protein